MRSYERRLETLEAASDTGRTFYVWRNTGESTRQAAERYAKQSKGSRTVESVLAEGMFVSWQEAA